MMCDACKKNEATVHLTQIVDNKMQTVDLCEVCSKAKGVDDPAGFSLASLLIGMGNNQETPEETPQAAVKCPRCGFTLADFKKAGRLGCAACYKAFAESMQPLLKSMHKGVQHVGKTPFGPARVVDPQEKVRQLQVELDQAIKSEDFEKAAVLRDEIKKLRVQQGSAAAQ